jgi:hypothetical protein
LLHRCVLLFNECGALQRKLLLLATEIRLTILECCFASFEGSFAALQICFDSFEGGFTALHIFLASFEGSFAVLQIGLTSIELCLTFLIITIRRNRGRGCIETDRGERWL